jgi:hypothetical protein
MVTLACVALGVGMPCAAGLVAFRWWLESRRAPTPDAELRARVESLEGWRSRAEMGRLR